MTDQRAGIVPEYGLAGDDTVVPFIVDLLDVRGRAVQIGPMLNAILDRHDYPDDVCFLLAELIVLTTLLGSSLKFEGHFILQTQSDGPVSLAVVDFATPQAIRAYVRFDEAALNMAIAEGRVSPRELLGNGVMALTIDQGEQMQRYQGVVQLNGTTLEEVAHQYFRQSEQIPTLLKLSVAQVMRPTKGGEVDKRWRAGGLLAQFFPDSESRIAVRDLPGGRDQDEKPSPQDDAWAETTALVGTIGDDELTDPQISVERLLYRLFHEHGVRVFEGSSIIARCTCSREKVVALVRSFEESSGKSELLDDTQDDAYETKCEFCGTLYKIEPEELV